MPTFEFQGRDATGKSVSGRRLAPTADSISLSLSREGIIPIHITPIQDEGAAWKALHDLFQGGRITADEMGIFARQMYTLCKTGVPVSLAIKRLAETARSARMTDALNGLAEALESGQDLAAAMQKYPKIFTPVMVSMIRVGQSSGRLDEAFLRLGQYIELESGAVKRLASATRYPLFIFITMIAAVIIVNSFVIPTFSRVFENAHIPLPALTIVLINISKFTSDYWYLMMLLIISVIGGIFYFLKTPQGRLKFDEKILNIPVIGTILKRIILLRFTQIFAIVTNAGVPLLEGLTLVAQALHNKHAEQEILLMKDSILSGKTLTQSAETVDFFTPLEIQMLAVSEETGDLSGMLEQMSSFYEREVDYDLKRLGDYIEPALIMVLAVVILMLAFAVYMPIWDMIKLAHM